MVGELHRGRDESAGPQSRGGGLGGGGDAGVPQGKGVRWGISVSHLWRIWGVKELWFPKRFTRGGYASRSCRQQFIGLAAPSSSPLFSDSSGKRGS